MEDFKTVYRVVGRRNGSEKPFILAGGLGNPLKTLAEAQRTMAQIVEQNKREVATKQLFNWQLSTIHKTRRLLTMAKKRERIIIDGETFIIENATTTNRNDNFKALYQCYDRPSFAKVGIYDEWYDWFAKNGSPKYEHGVESYNCMQFTYGGFIEIDGILYRAHITKSYNRLYKVV